MATDPQAVLEKLDRGMSARLTLVLAPGGSPDGSREMLRRWLEGRTWPCVHHSLTAADNAAGRFLANLAGALRPLLPGEVPVPSADDVALLDATAELLNALLDVHEDFALVLEDYHVITAATVHAAVTLMVDYPPPRMHLYLISRNVPPLPLPRLRVRRQLVEIDLRAR